MMSKIVLLIRHEQMGKTLVLVEYMGETEILTEAGRERGSHFNILSPEHPALPPTWLSVRLIRLVCIKSTVITLCLCWQCSNLLSVLMIMINFIQFVMILRNFRIATLKKALLSGEMKELP